ncbi:hypothetical protein CRENPOLYSF2_1210002 [Crenothrix polyspora]|uniref:Uncharacterized protein n=1 Tax=Crenothrix polyspora TaxID=360316 RepID=A0A1R4H0H4_9GAMM|nr:hypothetical protein CRENPOLYSF2_1210002 [Crenothrix polyspora]
MSSCEKIASTKNPKIIWGDRVTLELQQYIIFNRSGNNNQKTPRCCRRVFNVV